MQLEGELKFVERPLPKPAPRTEVKHDMSGYFAVVITSPSGMVHRASCPAVRQAEAFNRVKYFASYPEARKFSPTKVDCKDCVP